MSRKSAVTQTAVNEACTALHSHSKTVTVKAVIDLAGGSFSTVGAMVKKWREEQVTQTAAIVEMPGPLTQVMHRSIAELWTVATGLAGESVERIKLESEEALGKTTAELTEYTDEISKLEAELEGALASNTKTEALNADTRAQLSELQIQNATLATRLSGRDDELERLRENYDKLQTELLDIAKASMTR